LHRLTRSLFLRAIGVVFAAAFLSLSVQVEGLLGSQGLEGAASFLASARAALGGAAPLRVPTLFWLGASDGALVGACFAGAIAGAVLALGRAPLLASAACWVLYLSIVSVGGDFLLYQWDALLLEAGFLAILWAPRSLRLSASLPPEPSRAVLWLLRWLLFRLMFFSGWVKLASGDESWWSLTALAHHYETQPLPSWTSWYADQLPLWVQQISCAIMFAVELVLPLLIPFGRRARAIAFAGLVGLQALIAATGNYGFFNLLGVALCIPLLDDAQIAALLSAVRWRTRLTGNPSDQSAGAPAAGDEPEDRQRARLFGRIRDVAALAGLLALSTPIAASQIFGRWPSLPAPLAALHRVAGPFHLVGRYGLFAVMTTSRPEIVIEVSLDGMDWQPVVFRWKPGPLNRAPSFVEPHMPRLDWQMWFDALYVERVLGGARVGRELVTPRLVQRLLEGSAPVCSLLLAVPFGDQPPTYARWRLYDYRFTDPTERELSGDWWSRRLLYESEVLTRG
jgi:lipase maturation factor 1